MKRIVKYLHLLISVALVGYLAWSIFSGTTGYSLINATEIIQSIVPIILIAGLLFVIRRPSLGMQKRIIVAGSLAIILVAQALYTDTSNFYGGDASKVYATVSLFLALFGVFAGKVVKAKGQYSKKAEIIEV